MTYCKDCKYWQRIKESEEGYCTLNPPTVLPKEYKSKTVDDGTYTLTGVYMTHPITLENTGCWRGRKNLFVG
jgi:hypothetical protein